MRVGYNEELEFNGKATRIQQSWEKDMIGRRADFLNAAAGLAAVSAVGVVTNPARAQEAVPRQGSAAAPRNIPRPLVKIVATGGTIANSPTGRMAVDTVLAQIPQIAEHARIQVVDLIRVGSSSISVQNWIDIAATVNRIFQTEPEVAGIVVTHGSNTSEETAYFLSLTVAHANPSS